MWGTFSWEGGGPRICGEVCHLPSISGRTCGVNSNFPRARACCAPSLHYPGTGLRGVRALHLHQCCGLRWAGEGLCSLPFPCFPGGPIAVSVLFQVQQPRPQCYLHCEQIRTKSGGDKGQLMQTMGHHTTAEKDGVNVVGGKLQLELSETQSRGSS